MGEVFNDTVYIIYIAVFTANINFIAFLLLILSGDTELNPGPVNARNCKCCVLYSNVKGLHGNLRDLTFASDQLNILSCSETLVLNSST